MVARYAVRTGPRARAFWLLLLQGATTKVPGELMEVFVEKLLASAGALLGIAAELKRNALLNDFAGRNAEVAEAKALAGKALADLQASPV